ncbi:MAG: 3'(2'),5'-bisphosphate nucleotidase CysQ [Myxococcota bacterium]
MTQTLTRVIDIALGAGEVVLARYGKKSLGVQDKLDGSPVTDADIAADGFIRQELAETWPFPVLSEEGEEVPWEERKRWTRFWLVDPLDGTKDFLAGTGEFCVNIALIEGGQPKVAVIAAPISGLVWAAELGRGAIKHDGNRAVLTKGVRSSGPTVGLKSRFHAPPEADAYLSKVQLDEVRSMGSALKFGLIADGVADLIVSYSKSKAWDIAGGHLIATESGARIAQIAGGGPPSYAKEDLTNPPFVVGSPRIWERLPV